MDTSGKGPVFRDLRGLRIISIEDLPNPGVRWTPDRKALIVNAVRKGVVPLQDVLNRYNMTEREFRHVVPVENILQRNDSFANRVHDERFSIGGPAHARIGKIFNRDDAETAQVPKNGTLPACVHDMASSGYSTKT